MKQLPLFNLPAATVTTAACASFSLTTPVDWESLDPTILGAEAVFTGVPPWLSAQLVDNVTIAFESLSIPSMASGLYNISVTVNHTCRDVAMLEARSLQLNVKRTLVSIELQTPTIAGVVYACPLVVVTFFVAPGSCYPRVVPQLVNGSSLPSFLQASIDGSFYQISGEVPVGTEPLSIILVSDEDSNSSSVTIVRNDSASAPRIHVSDQQTNLTACPSFTTGEIPVDTALCGSTSFTAMRLLNFQMVELPPSIHFFYNAKRFTVTLYGTLSESDPVVEVVVQAFQNSKPVTSANVTVTRPTSLTRPIIFMSAHDGFSSTAVSINGSANSVKLPVRFGVDFDMELSVPASACGTRPLFIASALNNDTSSSTVPSAHDLSSCPPWLLASPPGASLKISGTPDMKQSRESATYNLFVFVADGSASLSYLSITLDVQVSLEVNVSGSNVTVNTPAPIATASVRISDALVSQGVLLLCPVMQSAVCSFDSSTGVLTSFGPIGGINDVLNSLRLFNATPVLSAYSAAELHVVDAINPSFESQRLNLLALQQYVGIRQLVSQLTLRFVAGALGSYDISVYFSSTTQMMYVMENCLTWLQLQTTFVRGQPADTDNGTSFCVLVVTDKYTTFRSNITILVRLPLPIAVDKKILPAKRLESSTQYSIILDLHNFTNPEGDSTILFDIRLLEASSGGNVSMASTTPLPPFLTYDAPTNVLTASPSAADTGTYILAIIASGANPYQASNSATVVVTVVLSAFDFMMLIYNTVAYASIGVSGACIAWGLRSYIWNLFFVRVYFSKEPPARFVAEGSHVIALKGKPLGQLRVSPTRPLKSWERHVPVFVQNEFRKQEALYDTSKFVRSWISLELCDPTVVTLRARLDEISE